MKKFIFLLFIPAVTKAQLYFGASFSGYKGIVKEASAPNRYVVGLHAGYAVSIFFAEGEERIDLITRKTSNNLFGIKSGLDITIGNVGLSPFAGYYLDYVSADNPALNGHYPAYGFKVYYNMDKYKLYVEGININTNQVSVGFNYLLDFSEY